MAGTLLITEPTRSYGEYRKPWVRRVHRRYLRGYRGRVQRAIERLAGVEKLTLLSARDLVDPAALPAWVKCRFYDESLLLPAAPLTERNQRLTEDWWPKGPEAPELEYRGVRLPALLTQVRGVEISLAVTEPLSIIERVIRETDPDRVVLLSGASTAERLAGVVAARRGAPVAVAARFAGAGLHARFIRWLQVRDARIRLRDFLTFPRRRPSIPPAGKGPRVLFVTCRARHHFVVDPLADAIRTEGAEPLAIGAPSVDPELDAKLADLARAGVACARLTDFLPSGEARSLARRHRIAFRGLWRRLVRARALPERLTDDGLSLAPFLAPLHRDSVTRTLPLAVLFQEAAFRALDALRPDAVVLTSNRRYTERALALAARARGIPCLLFSGSLLPGQDRFQFLDVADRLLVIGDHLRQSIVREEGVDPRLITVVGDPRSDAARRVPRERLREEVADRFGLGTGAPIVVFVSKYVSRFFTASEKEAFYRTMASARRTIPGLQVIVKVHPNEHLPTLQTQVREWGWPDARLEKDYDIHRLFRAADAVVMVTSMAGLEAMTLGCPVIAVQAEGKSYEGESMPRYVSEGVVERVNLGDVAGLAGALDRLLHDSAARAALVERARTFAARYVHPVDGSLGRRLLDVIAEVRHAGVAR